MIFAEAMPDVYAATVRDTKGFADNLNTHRMLRQSPCTKHSEHEVLEESYRANADPADGTRESSARRRRGASGGRRLWRPPSPREPKCTALADDLARAVATRWHD